MLYSESKRLAFAHFPKTAGCSLSAWFCRQFPDAVYVEPGNIHLSVRPALERLGLVKAPPRRPRLARNCLRLVRPFVPQKLAWTTPCDLKIIGVVREPFEMLVSLYEYWRRCDFQEKSLPRLIRVARSGSFHEFVDVAIGKRRLETYETFFDVGGPAWETTRLIDFDSLQPSLEAVCREFGLQPPTGIERINAAPSRVRDAGSYLAEAGSLVFEVRKRFRWYYEEAPRFIVRPQRVAAA